MPGLYWRRPWSWTMTYGTKIKWLHHGVCSVRWTHPSSVFSCMCGSSSPERLACPQGSQDARAILIPKKILNVYKKFPTQSAPGLRINVWEKNLENRLRGEGSARAWVGYIHLLISFCKPSSSLTLPEMRSGARLVGLGMWLGPSSDPFAIQFSLSDKWPWQWSGPPDFRGVQSSGGLPRSGSRSLWEVLPCRSSCRIPQSGALCLSCLPFNTFSKCPLPS